MNHCSIDAMQKWPRPKHKKEFESFIGFTNYHCDHIKKFSELAEPLHWLTCTKNTFEWSKDQERAFQSLKEARVHAVVLSYPTADDVFCLRQRSFTKYDRSRVKPDQGWHGEYHRL